MDTEEVNDEIKKSVQTQVEKKKLLMKSRNLCKTVQVGKMVNSSKSNLSNATIYEEMDRDTEKVIDEIKNRWIEIQNKFLIYIYICLFFYIVQDSSCETLE